MRKPRHTAAPTNESRCRAATRAQAGAEGRRVNPGKVDGVLGRHRLYVARSTWVTPACLRYRTSKARNSWYRWLKTDLGTQRS